LPVHTTQQLPPHMNVVGVALQLSPAALHGRRIASIGGGGGASTAPSGEASGSGGLASAAGASRSEHRPTTQRCGEGQRSELSHGAPSCASGL
jgi:hypothetical protein